MSEYEHDDHEVEEAPAAPQQPADSVWSQLRAEHAALASERKPLELEVPGYSGLLIRFRFVPLRDTEQATKRLTKVRSVTEQALYSAIDTLILACDEIVVRLQHGIVPLAAEGTPPVRFDHRLAEGMGWPDGLSARAIVRRLFGGEDGDYRIIEVAREVSAWMADEREEVADDFVGG